MVAFAFGLMMGLLSGTSFLLLLRALDRQTGLPTEKVIQRILGISTAWFAGPAISRLTDIIKWDEFIKPYAGGLALMFLGLCMYPAVRWVNKLAQELGGTSSGH